MMPVTENPKNTLEGDCGHPQAQIIGLSSALGPVMSAMGPLAYQQTATFFQHLHTALAKGRHSIRHKPNL